MPDRQVRQCVEIGDATGESGVHQPVRHLGIGQEQLGQRALGVLAATFPVSVSVGVPRQPEQRSAMRSDREPELGVERRIEVRQRFGVGLVETVLEPCAVAGFQPAAVHVVVHQRHVLDVLAQR